MIIVFWVLFSILAAVIAYQKGREAGAVFFLSLLLSPIVGIITALVLSPNAELVESRKVFAGTHKQCPQCAEIIKWQAAVCRFCGGAVPRSSTWTRTTRPESTVRAHSDPMPGLPVLGLFTWNNRERRIVAGGILAVVVIVLYHMVTIQ